MKLAGLLLAMLAFSTVPVRAGEIGTSEAVNRMDVYVVDGDTVRVRAQTYRLVGIDAPEIGETARCESEIEKGYEAKARVVDLVHSGRPLTLQRVACSCPPSAPEGSMSCNYGRQCGILQVSGEDVGKTLMREGLAKAYPYRWDRVPPKPKWCDVPASPGEDKVMRR